MDLDFVMSHNDSVVLSGSGDSFKLEYSAVTENHIVKSFMTKLHS